MFFLFFRVLDLGLLLLILIQHSTAHFNIRNEEVVVIEGPHSDVDDMTHLLTGFYVNYNETHH